MFIITTNLNNQVLQKLLEGKFESEKKVNYTQKEDKE